MSKNNWYKRNPSSFFIILILCSYLAIDVLFGFINGNSDHTSFRTKHFFYHHGLLPNQHSLATWNGIPYMMYTNSLGCRDDRIRKIDIHSSRRSLLIMGDSHTEGVGLNYEETFTGILQKRMAEKGPEIINGSAVSYSPRIYYLKTKYLLDVEKLRVDGVFVCIDISDLQNELVYEKYQPEYPSNMAVWWFKIKSFMQTHSFTLRQIKKISERISTEKFIKKTLMFDSYRTKSPVQMDALSLYAGFFSDFDDRTLLSNPKFHGVAEWIYDPVFKKLAEKGLELGQKNIIKLKDLCDEHHIPLTLSVHPWQEQIAKGDTTDMYVDSWRTFCMRNKIRFINLYPAFIHPKSSVIFGNDFFLPNDNHWNRAGNIIVANEFMPYLDN